MAGSVSFAVFAKDNASKVFDKVGSSATSAGDKVKAGGAKMASIGKLAAGGAAIAGVALFKLGLDATSAASDLNETLSKSNVIFGKNAKAIEKWANGSAKNFGLSKSEALAAASGFGDMFSQIGFTGDQAAKQSKNVVQMAADLGSFNNLETSDVLDRIAASMRGEFDSLQAVIPNINAARVETEALTMTGKKNAKELTAQEKATATLAIIQKDGARAMGDFARTSDGAANKQRIMTARLKDTQARVGMMLMPLRQLALDGFGKVLDITDRIGKSKKFQAFMVAVKDGAAKAFGWIKTNVMPILSGLWSTLTDAAARILPAIKKSFDQLKAALEKHPAVLAAVKAAVQVLMAFVRDIAVPAIVKAWSLVGPLFTAIVAVLDKVVIPAIKFFVQRVLQLFSWIVTGAKTAFGWIPGIGPALKDAAAKFYKFKDEVNAALEAIDDVKEIKIKITPLQNAMYLPPGVSGPVFTPKAPPGGVGPVAKPPNPYSNVQSGKHVQTIQMIDPDGTARRGVLLQRGG